MKIKDNIYSGITSDQSTWGMCCSEKMARQCAEDYYAEYREEQKASIISAVKNVLIGIAVGGLLTALNALASTFAA